MSFGSRGCVGLVIFEESAERRFITWPYEDVVSVNNEPRVLYRPEGTWREGSVRSVSSVMVLSREARAMTPIGASSRSISGSYSTYSCG